MLLSDAVQRAAVEPGRDGPRHGLDGAHVVQSAAHALECPIAVFYLAEKTGFEVGPTFGTFSASSEAMAPIIAEVLGGGQDLLVINDLALNQRVRLSEPLFLGDPLQPVRFVAATRVTDDQGMVRGVLVIADGLPHAGLSGAKSYVLLTHAAQLSLLLEVRARQVADRSSAEALQHSNMERLRLLESVVVNANDAVLITEAEPIDLPGPRIVYCNAAFTRTTGYEEAEILGLTPRLLQSAATNRKTLDTLRSALSLWKPIEVELLNQRKDGTQFWVELSIVPVANEVGWFTHWVSVQRDISDRKAADEIAIRARAAEAGNLVLAAEIQERKRIEARLLYTAFHDDLTKLRNRAFFMDRLKAALNRARSEAGYRFGVLFMDLDRFKLVNDSLGHRAGDLLLMEVATRLRACTRPHDTLARVGGDEFALLVEEFEEPAYARQLARRITETMRRPLWLGQQEIFSSCSVGVVEGSSDYHLPEELLRDADIAMYRAKRFESGSFAVFNTDMHGDAVQALELQTDLQNAVTRGEFFLEYQPICDSGSTAITGVEALIRWRHPQRGLVPPVAFIAAAEETGLIRDIGRWVLREACTQMRVWHDRYPGARLGLNVNVSADELKDPRFTADIASTLFATGIEPRTLQLEVTESIFLQHPAAIDEILAGIRAIGVRIALDDFGTGYSSLSYLDRYEMDSIKIDRSFVACMLSRRRTEVIVDTIVRLGRMLDLDIVAEGVESEAQMQALVKIGCGSVQGYLLGRPMSPAGIDEALARQIVLTSTQAAGKYAST